jgi:hypothetical protein
MQLVMRIPFFIVRMKLLTKIRYTKLKIEEMLYVNIGISSKFHIEHFEKGKKIHSYYKFRELV